MARSFLAESSLLDYKVYRQYNYMSLASPLAEASGAVGFAAASLYRIVGTQKAVAAGA